MEYPRETEANDMSTMFGRRSFPRLAVAGVAGATSLSACGVGSPSEPRSDSAPVPRAARGARSKILLAYFSRAGETYYYGGRRTLEVGNTEVLAGMIGASLACDVHRIEPVDRYPANYEETVERNVRHGRPAGDREPAALDRPVRHGAAGQPRLERLALAAVARLAHGHQDEREVGPENTQFRAGRSSTPPEPKFR
jgi:hypothetical protein